MNYCCLFIFVEGDDDYRFFENVIKPVFESKYDWVEVRTYQNVRKKYLKKFIRSLPSINGHYIYVRDFNNAKCISQIKSKITTKIKEIDKNNILVIVKKII